MLAVLCLGTMQFAAATPAVATQRGTYRGQPGVIASPFKSVTKSSPMLVKGGPLFWGSVVYSSQWDSMSEDEYPYAMYSFLASAPSCMTLQADMKANVPNGGGVYYDGEFKFVSYNIMYETQVVAYYYRYNTETWEQAGYPQYGYDSKVAIDLAYDANDGAAYGYYYYPTEASRANEFCKVTYGDYGPSIMTIATDKDNMVAVAVDDNGQVYALNAEGGFFKINKTTGEKTLVDYTGVRSSTFSQSAAYDPKSGMIYWAAFKLDDENVSSGLYKIDPATAITEKVCDFDNALQITNLYIPPSAAADNAPAAITDFAASFEKGSLDGTVTFTLPAETYAGDPLSGTLTYSVVDGGTEVLTGQGNAGSKVSRELTLTTGSHELAVRATCSGGDGPLSEKVKFFAGFDIPLEPVGVTATANSEGVVTVTWQKPTGTVNNGYLDEAALRYDVVRYPDNVKVATGQTATTFTETLTPDYMTVYSYGVTAVQHSQASAEVRSEQIILGDAFTPPFVDDFSTDNLYGLYKVVTPTDGSPSWSPSNQSFVIFYGWNPSDSYLMTPPVKLEGGKLYHFRYSIRSAGTYDTERFAVSYGQGEDPTTYTSIREAADFRSTNSDYTEMNESVTPAADGVYRFAIHACSDGFKSGLYVTGISVKADAAPDVPARVSGLTLTADADGAHRVTGHFKAPAGDINGNETEPLTAICVERADGTSVRTFESPAWGAELEFTDSDMGAGEVTYRVTAVNTLGRGPVAEATVRVGQDIPMAPTDARIVETADGITLSWNAPSSTGVNGGTVNPAVITYNIYDAAGKTIADQLTATSYDISVRLSATDVLFFNITAVTEGGESLPCASPDFVTGTPVGLPLVESFARATISGDGLWWTRGKTDMGHWGFWFDDYDGDDGCARWYPLEEDDYACLNSGRININNARNPRLFFSYYSTPGARLGLDVVADIEQNNPVTLCSFSFAEETGDAAWHQAIIEIPQEVVDAKYFVLRFRGWGDREDPNPSILVDAIRFLDMPDADASVSMYAPRLALPGSPYTADLTITNNGLSDLSDMTVDLLVDGKIAASSTVSALAFNSSASLNLSFTPTAASPSEMSVTARVTAPGDDVPANNETEALDVELGASQLAPVTDLAIDSSSDTPALTWSDPTAVPNLVFETFDHYTPWLTDKAGDWTFFDGDGVITNTYTFMHYPHIGEKLGFMVFNNDYAIMDASQEDIFTPLSGNQFMLAVANVHEYGKGIECEDWLISPELSGEEQTIEFKSKTLTDYEEDWAIYISSTDGSVETLRKNRFVFEKFGSGNQWRTHSYTLPAGTRYFAIVYTSNLSGLMIDNVKFAAAHKKLKSYNIYRDGEFVATVGADVRRWTLDTDEPHIYNVSAVYEPGESSLSNDVDTGADSVTAINTDKMAPGEVYTLSGIYLGHRDPSTLPTGFYIIDGRRVYVK